ncbi:hypothetical protein CcCBS67573_g01850 [Chytriomyces confervae]|uniref:Uncharacterized protein n=1 Tax=Chytriomyces confervae TaxID=246404 RepID=A0A507FN59_9FUNG|nr:hypothetical protein CcCBS67573_g01850 [Chytriomyces confervae]
MAENAMDGALLSASSTDVTSAACQNLQCGAESIQRGSIVGSNKFWQSEEGICFTSSCIHGPINLLLLAQTLRAPDSGSNRVQILWPERYLIHKFLIGYASLGQTFNQGDAYFQVLLNPFSTHPSDATARTLCTSQNYANAQMTRIDSCVVAAESEAVYGIRFTWGLSPTNPGMNGSCQMNVQEIIIQAEKAFEPPSPPPPVLKESPAVVSESVEGQGTVSAGGIVGLVLLSAVVLFLVTIFSIRQYNLRKRRRLGRLF